MSTNLHTLIHDRIWCRARGEASIDLAGVSWQLGHERLVGTAARRAALDAEEAVWLVVCEELGADRHLSFGNFAEYVAAATGREVHTAFERIRVARALVQLPDTFMKLADGELSWCAVRELTRVAQPDTEAQWLAAAKNLRVSEVQRLVAGRRPGDLPTAPADDAARRHVVRFEVQASTLALVRQAQDEYRRRTGESVDDDLLVSALARAYLSSTEATSAAAAQVLVTLCPTCHAGTATAGADKLPLERAELDHLCCDAQVLPTAQTDPVVTRAPTSQVGPALPATSHVGPAQPATWHVRPSPVVAEVERRAALMVATELPDTIRRSVLRRHDNHCAVPGCTNVAFLHLHHCDLRSEGGTHDPDRLLPICEAHHRAVHQGRLLIDGTWSTGFQFRHADATPYGTCALPHPATAEAARIAFTALTNSGYKQSEARAAVDSIRDKLTPELPLEQVVRLAFRAAADLPSQCRLFGARESLTSYVSIGAVAA